MQRSARQLPEEPTVWDTIYQTLVFGILIGVPLFIILVLFATNIYVGLGGALGLNIKRDANLIIYDVVCEDGTNLQQLNINFYTSDSAPIVVRFDGFESRPVTIDAGVNVLHVNIRGQKQCPSVITLKDSSRGRVSSQTVEVFTR